MGPTAHLHCPPPARVWPWARGGVSVRLAWWRPEALPPRSRRGTTRTSRRPRPPASASSCACAASARVRVCVCVGSPRPHTASSLARSSAPQIQTAATLRVLYQSLCPCVCRRKSNSSTSSSNSPLCTRPLAHTQHTAHSSGALELFEAQPTHRGRARVRRERTRARVRDAQCAQREIAKPSCSSSHAASSLSLQSSNRCALPPWTRTRRWPRRRHRPARPLLSCRRRQRYRQRR